MDWKNKNTEDLYKFASQNKNFKHNTLRDTNVQGYSLFGEYRLKQWHISLSQTNPTASQLLNKDIDYTHLALVFKAEDTNIDNINEETNLVFNTLKTCANFTPEFIFDKLSFLNEYRIRKFCFSDLFTIPTNSNKVDWSQLTVLCMAHRHKKLNIKETIMPTEDLDPFTHLDNNNTEKGKVMNLNNENELEYPESKLEERLFFNQLDISKYSVDMIIEIIVALKGKLKSLKDTNIKSKAITEYKNNIKSDISKLIIVLDSKKVQQ